MLSGLGHHRVIGRDDEQRQVEPGRAREHVADEPLVAWHVHQRQPMRAEVEGRKPDIDRDPALFLGGEPVGIDAGEHPHQRRLAVVDVARRADDQVAFHHRA